MSSALTVFRPAFCAMLTAFFEIAVPLAVTASSIALIAPAETLKAPAFLKIRSNLAPANVVPFLDIRIPFFSVTGQEVATPNSVIHYHSQKNTSIILRYSPIEWHLWQPGLKKAALESNAKYKLLIINIDCILRIAVEKPLKLLL